MAEFVYPKNGNFSTVAYPNQVNVFDKLAVTYNSTWPSLNLTLFCLQGTTSTSWLYWNVQGNPIISSGTYTIPSIQYINFYIDQYPTNCKLKLTKYGDNNIGTEGELFEVVSVTGTSTTYQMTSTATGSGSSSTSTIYTSQSATSTLHSSTMSTSTSATTSTTSSIASATSTTISTSSNLSKSSTGLSVGAQAGIGVGVGILVLVIALLTLLVFRQRRKLKERQHQPHPPPFEYHQNLKPELPGQFEKTSPIIQKQELDSRQQRERAELDAAKQFQKAGLHELG